jgi:phosphoglycerate transport regulatory protein PgtC
MTERYFSPTRRAFTQSLGLMALAGTGVGRAVAAPTDVVVLTAYPDEVVSRFEAAFEKAFPQYRLRIIWRMPHDALPTLRQPRQGGVDVYWSASTRNYAVLKQEGAWRKLDVDLSGLPGRIGNTAINDPDGFYAASETAAYGFAYRPDLLKKAGRTFPADWPDLAEPGWAGEIVIPDPLQVGFAPVLVDIPLQAYGWDRGWALWSAIAANARFVGRGATFISDEVTSGRAALGLTIDFFAASAIANGAPLAFAYPRQGGVNPAHIAITRDCANLAGARAFVSFVLSEVGQQILTHPDIRKLPVRPSVYAGLPASYHNPFAAAQTGGYAYDNERSRPRVSLVGAAFNAALIQPHGRLAAAWQRLPKIAGPRQVELLRLLEAPPLPEKEAADPLLQDTFARRQEDPKAEAKAKALELTWTQAAAQRLDRAAKLLEGA